MLARWVRIERSGFDGWGHCVFGQDTLKSLVPDLARSHLDASRAFERTLKQTTGKMTPSPQNNSNCYTRGPVELQVYKNCNTTHLKSKATD